jgi:hypothetical protein
MMSARRTNLLARAVDAYRNTRQRGSLLIREKAINLCLARARRFVREMPEEPERGSIRALTAPKKADGALLSPGLKQFSSPSRRLSFFRQTSQTRRCQKCPKIVSGARRSRPDGVTPDDPRRRRQPSPTPLQRHERSTPIAVLASHVETVTPARASPFANN